VDGSLYATGTTYDANGRIQSVTYPSGFGVTYSYTATGFLNKVADSVSGLAYWTANTYDAESHLTQETLGNGLADSYSYDASTGRLLTIQAGASGAVESTSYHWDPLGNLTQRIDYAAGLTDTLTYDGMNRLTQVVTSNPGQTISLTKTVAYDATGNITSRSDLGSYSYDPVHVHAVTAITGSFSAAYVYDADGNMTSGGGRTITWTSFNMVAEVVQGTSSLTYVYGSDHARIKQTAADGSFKYYLNDPTSGAISERLTDSTGTNVTWNDYIMAGGAMVAMHAITTGGIDPIEYFHRDHLGSIAVVTDASGNVLERDSYDAWGKRRYPSGLDALPTVTLVSMLTRGFSGQEQMDSVGLVNFNGRVYDPTIGRFLSADPFVQAPDNSQSYNRYSYLFNNPLSGVDPSGYFSFGSFFGSLFRDIGRLFEDIWHSTIGRALLAIAGAALGQWYLADVLVIGNFWAAVAAGAIGGAIGSGNLKGAIIGAVTAAAFFAVGDVSGFHTFSKGSFADLMHSTGLGVPLNVAGHAAVGCLASVAAGGRCGPQALAGAVGAAADIVEGDISSSNAGIARAEKLTISTVAGGIGSIAGGGKFANGAITGAFGYLFNAGGAQPKCNTDCQQDEQAFANTVSDPGAWASMGPVGDAVGDLIAGIEGIGTAIDGLFAADTTSVFWSGGDVAKNAAAEWAIANGGTTLEMTQSGQDLESITQDMDWTEAKPLWDNASEQFSSQALGEVHVFLGPSYSTSANSIFNTIELPNLLQNQSVTGIVFHPVGP
jgi:RHS repeat-associated protein